MSLSLVLRRTSRPCRFLGGRYTVSSLYDIMNDFMSGGMHRIWKDSFVDTLHPVGPLQCLDMAGGTGDIAFRIAEQLTKTPEGTLGSQITVCDINSSMLQVGEERAAKVLPHVDQSLFRWVEGNAEHLDFDDSSFDVYTIVFGIRNVTHVDRAIKEAFRVLKPGGRFMCMEFSQVPNSLLREIYDTYSFNVIPLLGEKVANDRASYQYLVESIRQFPPQEEFKAMIEDAGFKRVTYTNFTFGVTAMHSGFKF
uniref:2-methoxy-6-polyprenyl-1,4-benzoquinol methylase, mitochondrial n=2 Tax=Hyaloperonospora arabidopsidis (strain Emoy2) TaxID=559515 RepID=M4BGS6_HYAAE